MQQRYRFSMQIIICYDYSCCQPPCKLHYCSISEIAERVDRADWVYRLMFLTEHRCQRCQRVVVLEWQLNTAHISNPAYYDSKPRYGNTYD